MTTDFKLAIVARHLNKEKKHEPLIKHWKAPKTSISRRLKTFVARQQADFYVDIGFPYGVEFHALPTFGDWLDLLRRVRFFLVRSK